MKPSYPNGSVFLVPLQGGGMARGVVARTAPGGKLLLGYFFGPRLASTSEVDLSELEPKNAILCQRFGDLGLFKGLWPVVGKLPDWTPAKWPMPDTVRHDPLRGKSILVKYDDSDPSKVLSEVWLENDDDNGLPADGLAGYGFVEEILSKLLA
jgi:Immunity protein 26